MPRIWGEGPHEMYHHTQDGNWTHSGANGKSWKTLEEAKAHYHQSHTSEYDFGYLFLVGLICIFCLLLLLKEINYDTRIICTKRF